MFCEKPLAVDAAAAERMVAGVEAAGVVNQVGLVLRFLPSFRWLRQLVHDERAGRVLAVVFRDDQYIPIQGHYGSTWRVDAARGGRGHAARALDPRRRHPAVALRAGRRR